MLIGLLLVAVVQMLQRTSIATTRRIGTWLLAVHRMHTRAKTDGTNDFLNFVDLVANEAILTARIPECEVRGGGRFCLVVWPPFARCPKDVALCALL